jgi:hypothetical protein
MGSDVAAEFPTPSDRTMTVTAVESHVVVSPHLIDARPRAEATWPCPRRERRRGIGGGA